MQDLAWNQLGTNQALTRANPLRRNGVIKQRTHTPEDRDMQATDTPRETWRDYLTGLLHPSFKSAATPTGEGTAYWANGSVSPTWPL